MEKAYIQFQAHKNDKGRKPESSLQRSIKKITTSILKKVLPVANPDFENKIEAVEHWLVECDKENGIPQREIGLDWQGRVIMKMPHNDNYGYWTDNNLLLEDFKEHFEVFEISYEAFEQQWALFDKLSLFQTQVGNFDVLSTGSDGGHKYIICDIDYNGNKRQLVVFFASKGDEEKITSLERLIVSGTLMNQGVDQSLLLLDAVIVVE